MHTLPYDTLKSFAPVAIVATAPNVAVVNQDLPVKSIKELIALAKERPGKLQYASSGVGTFLHLGRRAVQAHGRRRYPARAVPAAPGRR